MTSQRYSRTGRGASGSASLWRASIRASTRGERQEAMRPSAPRSGTACGWLAGGDPARDRDRPAGQSDIRVPDAGSGARELGRGGQPAVGAGPGPSRHSAADPRADAHVGLSATAAAVFLPAADTRDLKVPPAAAAGYAVALALLCGLGATAYRTAWLDYEMARVWLALRGRLPWALMSFLDDAYQRVVRVKPWPPTSSATSNSSAGWPDSADRVTRADERLASQAGLLDRGPHLGLGASGRIPCGGWNSP